MEIVSMDGDTGGVNSSQNSEDIADEMDNSAEDNNSIEDNNDATDITNHLRQFDVLDEVQGDDSGSENGDNEQKGKKRDFRLFFTCCCIRDYR